MIRNVCVCLRLHWNVITILVCRVNLFRVIVANLSIDSAQTLRPNVFQHAPRLVHNRIPVGILWSSTFITYSQVLLFIWEEMHFCVLVFIYIFFFLWIPLSVHLKWVIWFVFCVLYGFSQSVEFANRRVHSIPPNSTIDPLTRGCPSTLK